MKTILFLCLVMSPLGLYCQTSQFQLRLDNSIPVTENQTEYRAAWNGGLNATQYNTMDLDLDGKDDLVLYDRTAQKVITYLRVNNEYIYSPEYETFFPEDIYNWLLLRDFNCDGKKDIFTGHLFGISVYENVSSEMLEFKHFPFYDGNSESEVILTEGLSGRINLQIQFDDLPSISDADGDGDLDIFVMNYGGSGMIQYHKNFGMEKYGTCDSMAIELVDPWWGGVRECNCGGFAYNKEDCLSGGRVDHAGGKSLVLMDGDGDGFKDLIITEGECNIMNMLDNNGPVDQPVIAGAPQYPLGIAEEFNLYPTGYYEDLDFDGIKDFIISPNVFSKTSYDMNLSTSNWFYKNSGTNDSPALTLQTKSLLQQTMIDKGDNVVPAFADLDADGDQDMFISNNELPSTISFYRNTGSAFEPQFQFEDDDFLDLSTYLFTLMKMQFTDINNDGKIDLVFTATDSQLGFTDVFYLLNKTSGAMDFSGQIPTRLLFQLAKGESVSFIYVDNDSRPDILKGKTNGVVEYWQNVNGTDFTLESPAYLGMTASIYSTRRSFAQADVDQDGKDDLIVGDESGRIGIISNFRSAPDASTIEQQIVQNELTQNYYAPDLGGRIWPATVNLYGTAKPVVVVGTVLGGLRLLRNVNDDSPMPLIQVYPNPVAPVNQRLTIISNKVASVQVLSVKGEFLRPPIQIPEKQMIHLTLSDFAAGVYILRFSVADKIFIRRLVVR